MDEWWAWWSDSSRNMHPDWIFKQSLNTTAMDAGDLITQRRVFGVPDQIDALDIDFLSDDWIVHFRWSQVLEHLNLLQMHSEELRKWSARQWQDTLGYFNLELASALIHLLSSQINMRPDDIPWAWLEQLSLNYPLLYQRVRLLFPSQPPSLKIESPGDPVLLYRRTGLVLKTLTLLSLERA